MSEASLPATFIARLRDIVPANQFASILSSFDRSSPTSFRVNILKATSAEVRQALGMELKACPWQPDCFYVAEDQRSALTHSSLVTEGHIYIQDLASVLIASLLEAQPGEEVLDLAAAPGGKTLVLASAMNNEGRIAAVEAVKKRFFHLRSNLETHGASCVECYLKDGRVVGRQVPERFDRVLLDAPCSSESRFSTQDPKTFQYWSEKKIQDMQRKQKQLLHSALLALKPGGRLVYSTCSFAPEENELVVERQLRRWGDQLNVVAIDLPFDNWQVGLTQWGKKSLSDQLKNARRILPNDTMGGFFVCVLEKK